MCGEGGLSSAHASRAYKDRRNAWPHRRPLPLRPVKPSVPRVSACGNAVPHAVSGGPGRAVSADSETPLARSPRSRVVEVRRVEPALVRRRESAPVPVGDREPRGVAVAALVDQGLAERALVAEPEPGGGRARGRVERVALPLVAAVAEPRTRGAPSATSPRSRRWCAAGAGPSTIAPTSTDAVGRLGAHQAGDARGPPARAAPRQADQSRARRAGRSTYAAKPAREVGISEPT